MIRIMLIFCLALSVRVTAGGNGGVDYSQLRYERTINSAIKVFAPKEFEDYCMRWELTPDMVAAQIVASYYRKSPQDTLDNVLLVYYASSRKGFLRVLKAQVGQNNWIMESQTDSVFAEAWPLIRCVDIDCDGANEIILEGFAGANSIRTFGIVKMTDDGVLKILTRFDSGNVIRGRYIDIDSTNNVCPRLIKAQIDGPVKYQPDSVRTYQFDVARQSYEYESVKALPKK